MSSAGDGTGRKSLPDVVFDRMHRAIKSGAYAVDARLREKTPAAELFHGTVTMFEAAGFAEVARPRPDRAIMEVRVRR